MRNKIMMLSLIMLLTGSQATVAQDANEVEQVLRSIGKGTAVEMKSRLITDRITVFNDEARARAIAALPAAIRDNRVTGGKLFRRSESILDQVLQLHERTRSSRRPELFLFQNEIPTARIWRGCVLVVSTGLVEPLYDGEMAGVFAHELSHSYFEDEMADAQRMQDAQAMRLVELNCDAGAILTMKLLGYNPVHYLKGLQRMHVVMKQKGLSIGIFQSHPSIFERARFSQSFIRSIY